MVEIKKPLWRAFKELGINPQTTEIGPNGQQPVSSDQFHGLDAPTTRVSGGRKYSSDPNASKGASRNSQGNGRREDGN